MTTHLPRGRMSGLAVLALSTAVLAGCATTPPGANAENTVENSVGRTSSGPAPSPSTAPASPSGEPSSILPTRSGGIALPKGVVDPASGLVANLNAATQGAPTLEVFEDFQCPACAQVHERLAPTVKALADAGKVRLVYHPMVFLDDKLGNDSSKTVTNAAACAADAGAYAPYHDAALRNQSAEGRAFTPAQIQQFAVDAGITGPALAEWKRCEAAGTYRAYVLASNETALASGVNGTPTFKLDGQELDVGRLGPDALVQAVERAGQ